MKNKIAALAKENLQTFIEVRRYLHENPELSFVKMKPPFLFKINYLNWVFPFL